MADSPGGSEPTFYETLGVGEDASVAEIRAAYRERAKDTHPDVSDAPDAGRRFKRVKHAHDVLTDERERRRYDLLGHETYVALGDSGTSENDNEGREGSAGGSTTDGRGAGDDPSASSSAESGTAGRTGSQRARTSGATGAGRDRRTTGGGTRARGGYDTGGHDGGAARAGTKRTGTEPDPFGRVTYGLARWLEFAGALVDAWQSRLGPAGAATALATFAAYPAFLASAVTPLFPLGVNLLVGLCTLAMLGYLVLRPEIGVAVLGAWLLVLPFALTVSGVGVVSLGGLYALVVTVVPLVLCVATLAGTSA